MTVCAFTTDPAEAPLLRLRVEPDQFNELGRLCSLMVDKLTTVPRVNLGRRVGRLRDQDLVRLDLAIIVFLGLA
jgi:mRNA interferase MazF